MSAPLRITLLVGLLGALIGFGLFVGGGPSTATDGAAGTARTWRSSVQCAECHAEVWEEWVGSHHQISYLNPEVRLLSDDFRNKECQACHLPRPIAVIGYGKRTLHRTTLPDEGVSCLTCHLGRDGEILGRSDAPAAPCRPRASAELVTVEFCASCHNQHETTDQWRATSYAASGVDCNQCHMPAVQRGSGARIRRGFDHTFRGSHDVDVLRDAVRLSANVEARELVLNLENHGAGHNFPTEERSRAADLMVRFEGVDDGDAEWVQAYRFRLPYRSEPLPDTTLPGGQTKTVRLPIPDGATAAAVRLWYRLTPFATDDDPRSALLLEQRLELLESGVVHGELSAPPPRAGSPFDPTAEMPSALSGAPVASTAAAAPLTLPGLPPLRLVPRLGEFAEFAQSGPAAPDAARMAELQDLMETAFGSTGVGTRLATLAKRSLLEADDAVWILERGLDHVDVGVRQNAAYELGRRGREASIPPLLLRLKQEEDPQVFAWLAGALAKRGNHAGLSYLISLMQQESTANVAGQIAVEICGAAGAELGEAPTYVELGERLSALHGRWLESGVAAGFAAPSAPDSLTTARLAAHLGHLEDFQLRGIDEARFVLARAGMLAVPLLERAVQASEPYLRTHTLEILRNVGHAGRPAAPAVLPLLGDELSRVDAITVLGRMGAEIATPHLLALLDAPDIGARAAAARALGEIGDPVAIAPLQKIFDDDGELMDVRVMAAFGLALLVPDGPARAWLEARRERGDYHGPTIVELLDRLGG